MEIHIGTPYSPTEGHSVVIYTHKFKQGQFDAGVKIVREQFPKAQVNHGKKRLNIFIERPDDNELVNISFFEGVDVDGWQKSPHRKVALDALKPMLDEDVGVQVFKIGHLVGVT